MNIFLLKKRKATKLLVALCLCCFVSLNIAQAQTIWYVQSTATGANDGTSWTHAYTDLQVAMNAAAVGDEIWVAAGTYKPAAHPTGCSGCNSTRDYTFYVKDGISIYGGFAGTEMLRSQRNIAANTTILSGDIGTPNDSTDNCYHVVVSSAPSSGGVGVTIDGFSVTAGNADDFSFGSITVNGVYNIYAFVGGGIYTDEGNVTISNNTLYNNTATDGAGISTTGGNVTISNNTLYNNSGVGNKGGGFGRGGGISTYEGVVLLINNTLYDNLANFGGGIFTYGGNVTISNNTLHNNNSAGYGGGIGTFEGNNTFNNNTLYDNSAEDEGGGIFVNNGTNTFTGNTLNNNSANYGGGIYTELGTNTFTDNTLSNNSAVAYAGGIYVNNGTNTFTGNTLNDNSASCGGGIYTVYGTNMFINNTLYNNTSINEGGGIYTLEGTNNFIGNLLYNNSSSEGGGINIYRGTITVTNNTLYNNSGVWGGGIFMYYSSYVPITNNIFWNNQGWGGNSTAGADIFYNGFDTPIVTHCLTQANSTYSSGTGIINNQDPLFVDAANGDFRLQASSPCINVGNNGAWSSTGLTTDLAGTTRPLDGGVDIGAYEYQLVVPVEMLYFTGKATENGNLLTWATATEENNAGFEVQQSTDARTFEKIGFVVGNGTTYEQQTYEFLDNNATNGVTYYRLKQMDFDGKFEYSNIVSISDNKAAIAEMLLYPNPVKDFLAIENGEGTAIIYNALGQPLQQFNITDTKYLLNTNELPKGIYTLQVRKADGTATVKQFVK